jgi:KAP-like P-loop domain-containing protein
MDVVEHPPRSVEEPQRQADASPVPARYSVLALLSDQPNVTDADPLQFKGMAESLAALVLASRISTPFTIGIEAGWGCGKSTLMRRLESVSRPRPRHVKGSQLNAWRARTSRQRVATAFPPSRVTALLSHTRDDERSGCYLSWP